MKLSPLVILHGWNLSAEKFTPLVKEFKKLGLHVYCFDLPGFGKSAIPDKPLSLSDYASYIKDYFDRKNMKKIILIGHSFGGRVAIKFATINSSYLHCLILTGTPGINPVPALKVKFFLIAAKIGNHILSLPILTAVKDSARKFLYQAAKATDFYNTNEKMRETFKNIIKENLQPYLAQISIPTLLLWGNEDTIVPVRIAQQMNRHMKNSKIIAIEGARHGLPWTHPKVFADKVIEFIQSHDQ